MVKKIIKRSKLINELHAMQNSPDCYGELEHKVMAVNYNSLRFSYPIGNEGREPETEQMKRLKEFGKACIRMGWFMAIESMRKELVI